MPLLKRGQRETIRIALPENGEWVEVIARLSSGERSQLEATGIKATMRAQLDRSRAGNDDVDVPLDVDPLINAVKFRALEIGIVAWSFSDPITPENIRALDEESHDLIAQRLDTLWDRRSDDERKNSEAAGPTPSSTEGDTQPPSPGLP